MMILLLEADANSVRGLTVLGHALAPVPLKDGTFVLPMAVLDDPHHAARHALLASFDVMLDPAPGSHMDPEDPFSPIVGGDYSQDPDVTIPSTYTEAWQPGVLQIAPAATGT